MSSACEPSASEKSFPSAFTNPGSNSNSRELNLYDRSPLRLNTRLCDATGFFLPLRSMQCRPMRKKMLLYSVAEP